MVVARGCSDCGDSGSRDLNRSHAGAAESVWSESRKHDLPVSPSLDDIVCLSWVTAAYGMTILIRFTLVRSFRAGPEFHGARPTLLGPPNFKPQFRLMRCKSWSLVAVFFREKHGGVQDESRRCHGFPSRSLSGSEKGEAF